MSNRPLRPHWSNEYVSMRWIERAALAVIVLTVITLVLVGCRGASSDDSQTTAQEGWGASLSTSEALPARTPVPPMTGQGSDTPVEEAGSETQGLTTPQPAITATQALVEESSNGRTAGSEPVGGGPIPPSSANAGSINGRSPDFASGDGGSTPPPATSNEAQVRAAIQGLWPASEVETAMRVAWCESRDDPSAVEPDGGHVGIYQLDPQLHGAVPSDIEGQAQQAYALWLVTGWNAWSCQ